MQSQIAAAHMTRQELYELVWTEPMSKLAKRFAVSDRGLAKICAKAEIPVPERGYWARLQAGQARDKTPLSAPAADTPQHVTIRPPTPRVLHYLLSMTEGDEPLENRPPETVQTYEEQKLQWQKDEERYVAETEQKKEEILLSRLIQQARDHRTASEIREFVSHVAASNRAKQQPEEFTTWGNWALRHADNLDPLHSPRLFHRVVSNIDLWSYSGAIDG